MRPSAPPPLSIDEMVQVGCNGDWLFGVGRASGRWIGFALGVDLITGPTGATRFMHVFSEVSERYQLGLVDRDQAIRLVGALAEDEEGGFGRVAEWFVPPELRGDPETFRCRSCGCVGCDGTDCTDDYEGLD